MADPPSPGLALVVDDERVMREGCARICQSIGCRVLAADGGEEGLRILQEQDVEVLILDMMMPGISGMDVLDRVREVHPDVVVIVITGYATVDLAVEAMKHGAYDFIAKPFTPDQLRLVVSRAFERRRLQKEAELLRHERARSLRDVAEEKSRLRTIIHSMADGVVVTDRDGIVVLHNPPAGRLLGLGEAPLLNRPLGEVAPEEVGGMVRTIMAEAPGTARSLELAVDGVGNLRAHGSPVHLSEHEVLGSVTVIQDITALKEMDRMKSDFVAMVSHELRSPLAAIKQQLEVMGDGLLGEITDRQTAIIDKAKRRVEGLLDLINDLLDLARIEAGRVVGRREPVHIGPLLKRTVEFYRGSAEEKGIGLTLEPFPPLPTLVGDPDALEEVFTNLLSNAISYTPSGGVVCIRCGTRGSYVCVEVRDSGVGIPSDALTKIFDRFYRVKNEKTRHVVGTGLGLPIVKGIVEAHFGAIEVESEEGKGSTFRVLFPEAPSTVRMDGETAPGDKRDGAPVDASEECPKSC